MLQSGIARNRYTLIDFVTHDGESVLPCQSLGSISGSIIHHQYVHPGPLVYEGFKTRHHFGGPVVRTDNHAESGAFAHARFPTIRWTVRRYPSQMSCARKGESSIPRLNPIMIGVSESVS